ncbi:sugar porter family MFS transporter [Amycolatopsis cynarae]|uniref:Sugar porter family MFS transporter n=1 Tax=Amycolatopsis cynarae TaxID=2995223 RepID=A0ABY7BBZ5_9PSEU|nr:sugar porter family MFS transporter [Amycolatopsis sp. HUAS 11-8]WAL68401.1 sugar porter family MFS transporter [Amycolatopsis sp. HUAS 11-8]
MQHPATAPRQINRATLYFFGALGGILFGYDLGVISGVLLYIKKIWSLGSVAQGTVGACLAVGAMVGAAFAGRLCDRIGRRRLIMLAAAVFSLGTLGCALAPGVTTLIVFRTLVGVAVGASSATVPTYLAELAPTRTRGMMSSLNQIMIVGGILIAYVVDWALSFSANWRAMLAAALLPALALMIGMAFLPETPRWLLARGQEGAARQVIRSAQGDVDVDAEIAGIREVIRLDARQRGRLRDLVTPMVRPALVVALILAIGQQFCGNNAVNFYAPTMFTDLGFGKSASLLASIVLGAVKLAFTAWVVFVVDRWGRKPLLLIGNVCMAATLLLLGVAVLTLHSSTASGVATLVLLMVYLAGYELGWGAIVWLMMSEVFPLKARGVGMGVSSVVLWAGTFGITFLFPIMNNGIGLAYSAWIFAAVSVVLYVLVAKFVPETKGRSLEQIELDLRARVGGTAQPATPAAP